MDNKNLGLRYYANIENELLSDVLRNASIDTENQLMMFYDYICQDYPYTGSITGAYMLFYQDGKIDYCTHVPVTISQSSSESDYNVANTVCRNGSTTLQDDK